MQAVVYKPDLKLQATKGARMRSEAWGSINLFQQQHFDLTSSLLANVQYGIQEYVLL
jgi:hypothetical protein